MTKGKATKKNAQDALKISRATLATAQAKYDAASASGREDRHTYARRNSGFDSSP